MPSIGAASFRGSLTVAKAVPFVQLKTEPAVPRGAEDRRKCRRKRPRGVGRPHDPGLSPD